MQSSTVVFQGTFTSTRTADFAPMAMLAIAQREGEDANLCGMTRSLNRRLLALNMPGSLKMHRKPITSVTLSSMAEKRIA